MVAHPNPRSVFVAGGGEGATIRQVLSHTTVRRVVMVDIDREVVELCRRYDIAPGRAVMIDDIPRNLKPAAEIGMTTVWKKTDAEWAVDAEVSDYIHHVTDDLLAWLQALSNRD